MFPNTAGCSGSVASGSIGWDYTWVWQNFYQELGAYTHGGQGGEGHGRRCCAGCRPALPMLQGLTPCSCKLSHLDTPCGAELAHNQHLVHANTGLTGGEYW